jgi:Ser-tRNA(Ala) deacylase AlaX
MLVENPLYIKDCYLKEWDATVAKADGKYIVLENTAFYPNSGGQPWDEGVMVRDGAEFRVVFAGKFGGAISHEVDKEGLKAGDRVHCKLDWERRYMLMRYHTCAHIVSKVIRDDTGAMVTGNQLSLEKGRIDFSVEEFDKERLASYEQKVNEIISRNLEVRKYFLPREEALKIPELFSLRDKLPPETKELRIVEIGDFDRSACGGTHLDNTSEIGTVKFTDFQNKGKNNRRVYFIVS